MANMTRPRSTPAASRHSEVLDTRVAYCRGNLDRLREMAPVMGMPLSRLVLTWHWVILAFLVVASPSVSAREQRGPAPVPGSIVVGDFPPPPRSARAMFDAADVVAVVVVRTAGQPAVKPDRPDRPVVTRMHQLRLVEVLKGTGLTSDTEVNLEQIGGSHPFGDRVIHYQGETILIEGQEGVLFLRKSTTGDYYRLPWGDASVVRFDRATNTAVGFLSSLPEFAAARTPEEVTSRLRALKSK
jgi:hypothetical protein